jgi:hypothetical protein
MIVFDPTRRRIRPLPAEMNAFLQVMTERQLSATGFRSRGQKVIVMKNRHRIISASAEFPWQLFWLLEVVFLTAPTFFTIVVFRRSDPVLTPHRLAILLAILIGLTAFNLLLSQRWKART